MTLLPVVGLRASPYEFGIEFPLGCCAREDDDGEVLTFKHIAFLFVLAPLMALALVVVLTCSMLDLQ